MTTRYALAGALLLAATPACAQERDFCPSRPGLGTTPCIISAGRVAVETGLVDWTLDDGDDERTDRILIGDTLGRIGLTDSIEAQIGWTPYGHVRTRDRTSGLVDRTGGVGDISLGMKGSLLNPDGKHLSIAVQPFVTVPVGHAQVGAGDWGGGVVLPATYDLNDTVNLQTTSEVDAVVNDDGHGRHLAYSETLGLGVKLGKQLAASLEAQVLRDEEPGDKTTQGFAGLSFGWMPNGELQLDVGAIAGLNRDAPDVELTVGISRRF